MTSDSPASAPESGALSLALEGLLPAQVDHIGIAVFDVDEAVQRYSRLLGIATWRRIRFSAVGQYQGSTHRITGIAATGSLGNIGLELVTPDEGRWTASDVLATRGECAYHLGYRVDDLAATMDALAAAGIKRNLVGREDNGNPLFAYLESPDPSATMIELVSTGLPPSFFLEIGSITAATASK